jgi:predicted glutamine amidotransferase
MCGLIAVMSKKGKRANQYALDLYKKQASRGKAGYGYLAIHDGKLVSIKRAKDEETITKYLKQETAETILFHHRFPTSTDNSIGTTHPIFVSHAELECDYYLAHNGVITNPLSLQIKHNDLGYDYTTEHRVYEVAEFKDKSKTEMLGKPVTKFNDSESLAIEFARYVEGLSSNIATTGGVAFWAVALEKGTNNVIDVYFGKNKGRDLCKINTSKWLVVTSITGKDIDPMVLNKVDINTLTINEFELDIDEAKPVEIKPAMGYHVNVYKYEQPAKEKIILERGKEYTSEEVTVGGHLQSSQHIGGRIGCCTHQIDFRKQ